MTPSAAMWDLAPRLEGRLVVLEPLSAAHADGLFEAARAPEIWKWWPLNPGQDRATFDRWLDGVLRAVAAGTEGRFATRDADSGRLLGGTSFINLRPEHRGLEIGWTWLHPDAWNTGANGEAKLLQLSYAFDQLGCVRVEFLTDELNERSRRALAALPAQFEGVLRRHRLLATGRWRSSAVYSVVRAEWPTVQENLRRRLAGVSGPAVNPQEPIGGRG